jgi:hypothetical protein
MLDAIARQLGEHLQRDEADACFLLIDPLLREPFPEDWPPVAAANVWEVPIKHPSVSGTQRPRLIRLDARNVALLEASVAGAVEEQRMPTVEAARGFSIGGWLWLGSPADPSQLARHLARCMQLRAGPGGTSRLIRWHDRRVLEWMWPALSDEQRSRLLGPIRAWTVLDRRNRLVTYRTNSERQPGALSLTATQWVHGGLNETVQDLLRGWMSFANELPADYLAQAHSAAIAVDAAGVTHRQDRTLMAAYLFQVHLRLLDHPRVQSAVTKAIAGETTLAQALEDIPDPEGWTRIRDELNRSDRRADTDTDRDMRHG